MIPAVRLVKVSFLLFKVALCEKCPNKGFAPVCIFPHLDWMQRDTEYLSIFTPNAGKYIPEKTAYLDTFHPVLIIFIACCLKDPQIIFRQSSLLQGRCEGTSKVAFEILIIKPERDFINLFIFNCLMSNINLFIFNSFTLNRNLFNFNCFTSNFCFPKNIFFARRREWLFMDARP